MINTHSFRNFPFAPSPLSAGPGEDSGDGEYELLDLNVWASGDSLHCRVYRVSGHSALPRIHHDDLVVVDPLMEPKHGDIIAFSRNGLNCIKILELRPRLRLVSANDAYGPQEIDEDDDFHCLGVVKAYFGHPRPNVPPEPKIVREYAGIRETATGLFHVEMVTETGEKVELYFPKKEVAKAIKMATAAIKEKITAAFRKSNVHQIGGLLLAFIWML